MTDSEISLLYLSDEVLVSIIIHLGEFDHYKKLKLVCRRFYEIVNSEIPHQVYIYGIHSPIDGKVANLPFKIDTVFGNVSILSEKQLEHIRRVHLSAKYVCSSKTPFPTMKNLQELVIDGWRSIEIDRYPPKLTLRGNVTVANLDLVLYNRKFEGVKEVTLDDVYFASSLGVRRFVPPNFIGVMFPDVERVNLVNFRMDLIKGAVLTTKPLKSFSCVITKWNPSDEFNLLNYVAKLLSNSQDSLEELRLELPSSSNTSWSLHHTSKVDSWVTLAFCMFSNLKTLCFKKKGSSSKIEYNHETNIRKLESLTLHSDLYVLEQCNLENLEHLSIKLSSPVPFTQSPVNLPKLKTLTVISDTWIDDKLFGGTFTNLDQIQYITLHCLPRPLLLTHFQTMNSLRGITIRIDTNVWGSVFPLIKNSVRVKGVPLAIHVE